MTEMTRFGSKNGKSFVWDFTGGTGNWLYTEKERIFIRWQWETQKTALAIYIFEIIRRKLVAVMFLYL